MIEIVGARPHHIATIAHRARAIDRVECAVGGSSVKQALRYGLSTAFQAWTAKVDGRPEAMFGVSTVTTLTGRGVVWMIMTDDAAKKRTALLRLGRRYTEALQRHFDFLENYVHADNDLAIRWLSRLGFVVGPVDVIRGHPMRYFVRAG